MRINTNIDAMNAQRNLNVSGAAYAKSIEKLSSGLRINRAADDAAGLSISEKLRSQVRGVNQAIRNSQDGISMIQTAEGALNEVHEIVQRMRELSVQAGNDTLSAADRVAIGDELVQLRDEINGIAARTNFNGKALLDGSLATAQDTVASDVVVGATYGATAITALDVSGAEAGATYTFSYDNATDALTLTRSTDNVAQTVTLGANSQTLNFDALGISVSLAGTDTADNIGAALDGDAIVMSAASGNATFQIGADTGQTISASFNAMNAASIGGATSVDAAVTAYANLNTSSTDADFKAAADALRDSLDQALADISAQRSELGSVQNRLEHTVKNLAVTSENLAASESRIRDADMAAETVAFTKAQILQQAGTAILAQANQAPQSVLSLLR
ncbi:MAG TPA: flagellin [Thermomicrobiales bacterium]|nr:flagellin [Thermomicrobiales bacterium]